MLALVLGLAPGIAYANYLQFANAVDTSVSPPEIQYTKQGSWQTHMQYALDKWNTLDPVNIRAYTACCNDLILTSDATNTSLCGAYYPMPGADVIRLHTPTYNGLNTSQRDACALHEVGHALSLAHNANDLSQVMDQCPVCYNPTIALSPKTHDIQDYHAKWGF